MLNRCLRATWNFRPAIAAARTQLPHVMPAAAQPTTTFQAQNSYNGQSSQQASSGFNFAHYVLLGTAVSSYIYLHQYGFDLAFAAQPSEKEDSQGNKQNKVRFFGTPQQIFKQFASAKDDDGEDAMSYQDFYKALTPYNFQKPKDNKDYFKKYSGEVEKIMTLADPEKDGSISFAGFYFFCLICQTPSRMIAVDFKRNGGSVSVGKLAKIIGSHKLKTNFNQKSVLTKK
jgi:hypothetical protein